MPRVEERRISRPAVGILAPQPTSPVSVGYRLNVARKPAVSGLLALGDESLRARFDNYPVRYAQNLWASLALWPFSGEPSRSLGSIALRDRRGSALN
jgi:hypothetical protein